MAYRLVRGDTLMRKVLADSMAALSVLADLPEAKGLKLGTLGRSYGGNTVLFHSAIDDRITFACSSGAACSYRRKLASNTGIEMAEVIPGFAAHWDIEDLVRAIAPLPLFSCPGKRIPTRQMPTRLSNWHDPHMQNTVGPMLWPISATKGHTR
jgi:cephalosporin-C deacetylase-like acetyl esterase